MAIDYKATYPVGPRLELAQTSARYIRVYLESKWARQALVINFTFQREFYVLFPAVNRLAVPGVFDLWFYPGGGELGAAVWSGNTLEGAAEFIAGHCREWLS